MAQLCKSIKASMPDEVGRLAGVTAALKEEGVNILALCAWTEDGTGKLLMVTDANEKACARVQGMAGECGWAECVCVKAPNTPGALHDVATKLADAGINIEIVYATAGDAAEATLVLFTGDNAKAAELL